MNTPPVEMSNLVIEAYGTVTPPPEHETPDEGGEEQQS